MRLLLVEDDIKIAQFVVNGLREAGFAVDHAANGEDGLHLALTEPYDVAVVDLMLPKLDGLTLIEEVRGNNIDTPVLILSAKRSVDDRVKGLKTGSDDYLVKPFAFSELLARVQALIRRATRVTAPSELTVADLTLDLHARRVFRAMRNAGRVVSKTMIMEHVWDYNFSPQTNVVEARVCYLRDKIDKHFDIKLIHTVRGVGYVLKEAS
jgi:two-component system OmpR family response regulator